MNFILKAHFTKNIEPGVSDDQRTEDGADTSSGPSNSHGGGAGSDELGGGVNVSVDLQQWIVTKMWKTKGSIHNINKLTGLVWRHLTAAADGWVILARVSLEAATRARADMVLV